MYQGASAVILSSGQQAASWGHVVDAIMALLVAILTFVLGRIGKAADVRSQATTEALGKVTDGLSSVMIEVTKLTAVLGPTVAELETTNVAVNQHTAEIAALKAWKTEHERMTTHTLDVLRGMGAGRRTGEQL